jgi:hypothetical protein
MDNRDRSVRLGKDGDVTDFFLVDPTIVPHRTDRSGGEFFNGMESKFIALEKSLSLVGNSSHMIVPSERAIDCRRELIIFRSLNRRVH